MCVQASNIISSNVSQYLLLSRLATRLVSVQEADSLRFGQIYRTDDAPLYRTGNKVLLGLIVWSFSLMVAIKFYYSWKNKKRDLIWNSMSPEQRDEYLRTTTDQGNKRLDFRFAH